MKSIISMVAVGLLVASSAMATTGEGLKTESVDSNTAFRVMHNSCNDVETFTSKAAVHSSSSSFSCGYSDKERAKRLAEDSALSRCLRRGFSDCYVQMSYISKTGYLGYEEGFDDILGYGCLAEAIVRGQY